MPQKPFVPRPGQIDYTNIRWAPVINCLVRYNEKILLVKRSEKLHYYPGYWTGVSGFLDDHESLEEKVKEELQEELTMASHHIQRIRLGSIFHQEAPEYRKTWIVHPILVDVDADTIQLDREGSEYTWTKPDAARSYKLLPGFATVLDAFFSIPHG